MTSVLLKDLCQIKHGGTPSKSNPAYWIGSIPWVSPKDMKSSVLEDATDHISEEAIAASATSLVPSGTVLVVARSGILAHTLPVARVGRPLAFNQDIKALLPHSDRVDPEYLYWFVRGSEATVLTRGVKKGATVHSLLSGFLENLLVPLPSRERQRRVVDLLSRAEGIVRLRREAQKKSAAITQALFLDTFGDPVTNSKGWSVVDLESVVFFQEGPGVMAKDFRDTGTPLVRLAGLNNGRASLNGCNYVEPSMVEKKWSHFRLVPGDILVLTSATFGNPAVVDDAVAGAIFYTGIVRFRPKTDALDADFLRSFLGSPWFMRQALSLASGAVIKHFGPTHLRQMTIPLPPLELQRKFTRHLPRISSIRTQQDSALAKAEAAFSALLARTFSVLP